MTGFSITIEILASPERVWSVMSDFERWHEWTPTVTSIKRLDGRQSGIGSRLLIRQPKLPPAIWCITELNEGRSVTSVTRSPGVCITAEHSIKEITGGSCVTLSVRFSGLFGPLVARFTRRLNERYLALEAKGLKERSEEKK